MSDQTARALLAGFKAFIVAYEAALDVEPVGRVPAPPMPAEGALLRKGDLADALRVSSSTIDRYVRAGMPVEPFGTSKRFTLSHCLAWVKSRPSARAKPEAFLPVRLLSGKGKPHAATANGNGST